MNWESDFRCRAAVQVGHAAAEISRVHNSRAEGHLPSLPFFSSKSPTRGCWDMMKQVSQTDTSSNIPLSFPNQLPPLGTCCEIFLRTFTACCSSGSKLIFKRKILF